MRFFSMERSDVNGGLSRCVSYVQDRVEARTYHDYMPWTGMTTNSLVYAFRILGGKSDWEAGTAYGFEFANLTLPHNYIFGNRTPTDYDTVSVNQFYFDPATVTDSQDTFNFASIALYALRPSRGGLSPVSIGSVQQKDLRQ